MTNVKIARKKLILSLHVEKISGFVKKKKSSNNATLIGSLLSILLFYSIKCFADGKSEILNLASRSSKVALLIRCLVRVFYPEC